MKVSLILACAGKGERAGCGKNKLLVKSGGTTCLEKTLSVFKESGLISEFVIAVAPSDLEEIKGLGLTDVVFTEGGKTRTDSVKNALKKVSGEIVLIHDGARPFVRTRVIRDCVESVKKYGSAITVYP